MSFRLYNLAWAAALDGTTKVVLLRLVDHARDDGSNVWPSIPSLAGACGLSERTVQLAMKRLRALGALVVVREADYAARRPVEYRLDVAVLEELPSWVNRCSKFTGENSAPVNLVREPVKELHPTGADSAPEPTNEPIKEPLDAAEAAPKRVVEAFAEELDLQIEAPGAVYDTSDRVDAGPVDKKKPLYDFGRTILGKSSGGQITKLINHHCNDLGAVDRTLRLAATKSDAREYVGAILRGDDGPRFESVIAETTELYSRLGVQ